MARYRSDNDERAEYERLRAKYEQPHKAEPADDDNDGIMLFFGRRADQLLHRLFGDDNDQGDEDQDDYNDQGDEDEDDYNDQDDEEPDPTPPPGHKFFRRR